MLLIRTVSGESMSPTLKHGRIVVAQRRYRELRLGDVVIIKHDNIEKLKRITAVQNGKIYIEGDNAELSTDSRHFGWIDQALIQGKVLWPTTTRVRP